MVLFDRRRHDPRDPDAVAAHEHRLRLTLLIEHGGMHGLAVQLSQLENMAYLDAARDLQRSAAAGAGVAALRIADIDGVRSFQVAPPVRAAEVHVLLVGAADEVRQMGRGIIDIDLTRKADGPDETGFRSRGFAYAVGAGHAQRRGHSG